MTATSDNGELQTWANGDAWSSLKAFTDARIALGRAGTALPTNELLRFQAAHAHARDAVHSVLNIDLQLELEQFGLQVLPIHSCANDRLEYLQRPDLGRLPNPASIELLQKNSGSFDLCICVADGLSATGINNHIVTLLKHLMPALSDLALSPLCLIRRGRVAIGDHVASILQAKMCLMLIGERPGLSAADSIGAYITVDPTPGTTDESRNCVSNIRPGGLSFETAVGKIMYLIVESRRTGISGVGLKENAGLSSSSAPSQRLA
jgi:ethanolamine ammonia-lyase small subunit